MGCNGAQRRGPHMQIDGIQRLAAQLQALAEQRVAEEPAPAERSAAGAAGGARGGGGGSWISSLGGDGVAASMSTAATILRWTAAELGGLSEKERRAVLQLPLDLVGRVSSRAAARTIRLLAQ